MVQVELGSKPGRLASYSRQYKTIWMRQAELELREMDLTVAYLYSIFGTSMIPDEYMYPTSGKYQP
jgi:hypothetical protein